MNRAWTALTSAVLATFPVGCQPPPKPAPPPPPPPPPMTAPQARAADSAKLRMALQRYDDDVAPLPGRSRAEHRALAATTLADLTQALRLAYGPNPSPAFATAAGVIAAAAATVGTPDIPPERMEAAETQALHGAVVALNEIAGRVLFDDAELPPLIDAAGAKADAARLSQGPLHDGDATDAYRSIQAALHRVADDMNERFTPGQPGEPMAVPATMPATTLP